MGCYGDGFPLGVAGMRSRSPLSLSKQRKGINMEANHVRCTDGFTQDGGFAGKSLLKSLEEIKLRPSGGSQKQDKGRRDERWT